MSRDKGYDPYNNAPRKPLTIDFETFSEHTANSRLLDTVKAKLLRGERLGASHDVQLPPGRYIVGSTNRHGLDYTSEPKPWPSDRRPVVVWPQLSGRGKRK
jgi:hypothetical protein